jgi:hypothetical protein
MFCNRHLPAAWTWVFLTAMPGAAMAFQDKAWQLEPVASTHWVEFSQGSELSKLGASYLAGGFESATGQWVGFEKWYRPKWVDTRLTWMTQLTPQFGVLWGASTGERAEKYSIAPSLKLGFVYQFKASSRSYFSLKATSVIGGRMKERACTADYGDIGGLAQVNCRLAATEMAPEDTLKHLTNALPPDRNSVQIRYTVHF